MRARRAAGASARTSPQGRRRRRGARSRPGPVERAEPTHDRVRGLLAQRACARRARERSRSEDRRGPARRSSARRSTESAMRSSVKSRAALETARRGRTSAPKKRVCKRPETADRAEPVTSSSGRGDGARPVRHDAELIRRKRVRLLAGKERHGVVRHVGEQPVELRDGLALRETPHVDARNARTGGELARRAREREPQQYTDDARRAPRRWQASRGENGCARVDERAGRSEASRRAPDAEF